jgi:P-type Ca2+ transporter type 2C
VSEQLLQVGGIDVDISTGLSSAQVEDSRARSGTNTFSELPQKTVWDFLKEALADPMIRILMVAAVVSVVLGLATGEWIEGVAIVVAVAIVTAVGTINQLRAQSEYSALDAVAQRERVKVFRDGHVAEIEAEALVVGDVVELTTGDIVPADMVFARGADLLINEAHITGEPDTEKEEGEPLYGSSRILDGSGRGVVTSVGDATTFGKIRREIGEKDKTTPLQERLTGLAEQIGTGGKWAAVVTFFAFVISGFVTGELELEASSHTAQYLLEAVTIAITIVVVAVPEGLPLAVTISLAYTTRRMAADKALVRELAACETMGAATIVCTDKTGTLTAGHMTLHAADILGQGWTADELETIADHPEAGEPFRELAKGISINSSADLVEREGQTVVAGNSTDGALLRWLVSQDIDYRSFRDNADIEVRREFNSTRKHMLTAVRDGEQLRVYMKGAPEIVLRHCASVLGHGGESRPLSDELRERLVDEVRDAARRGLRTLGIASGVKPLGTPHDDIDLDLRFDALLIIADPLRAEVPEAVERCRRAGVSVMMITGDIRETAAEIGRRSGIVSEGDIVLEGDEFRDMSDDDVKERIPRITALARALPDDKKRMVELLQSVGHVVAVTGDGVNDAPALVTADVGFSMGSGSKVAREASDIVIVDDNFVSLVRAIRWGRSVFENIRKFLQFQLTINVVALSTAFLAALLGFGTPLTAVQLLWVNLIMDSLAALALALEPPTDDLFEQPPHGRDEPLISKSMWINIITIGIVQFVILAVILISPWFVEKYPEIPEARIDAVDDVFDAIDDEDEVRAAEQVAEGQASGALTDDDVQECGEFDKSDCEDQLDELEEENDFYRNTFLFNAFVWMQIFNWINARSVRFHRSPLKGVLQSHTFLAVVAAVIVLQLLIVSFGGDVFSTTQQSGGDWLLAIAIGATMLPISWALRAFGRARFPEETAVHR